MEISLVSDTLTVGSQQALGSVNSLLRCRNFNLTGKSLADQSSGALQISAVIIDAIAPPPVRSNPYGTARRSLLRKRRRTRRRLPGDGDYGEDSDDFWVLGGDFGDGSFGGGGGSEGGGGRGWDFGGSGGQNWEESSWSPSFDFAYGFVYEVICWIALSNCVHFAFKRILRILASGLPLLKGRKFL